MAYGNGDAKNDPCEKNARDTGFKGKEVETPVTKIGTVTRATNKKG